jgi:hypothetical protein
LAQAAPMPVEAPVMSTALFLRSSMGFLDARRRRSQV